MKIDIKKLAKLANLPLEKGQLGDLEKSIPLVIAYMDEVKNLDIDAVPETFRVTEESNILREDEIKESLSQEEALNNAKKTYKGFFVVPYIFNFQVE